MLISEVGSEASYPSFFGSHAIYTFERQAQRPNIQQSSERFKLLDWLARHVSKQGLLHENTSRTSSRLHQHVRILTRAYLQNRSDSACELATAPAHTEADALPLVRAIKRDAEEDANATL